MPSASSRQLPGLPAVLFPCQRKEGGTRGWLSAAKGERCASRDTWRSNTWMAANSAERPMTNDPMLISVTPPLSAFPAVHNLDRCSSFYTFLPAAKLAPAIQPKRDRNFPAGSISGPNCLLNDYWRCEARARNQVKSGGEWGVHRIVWARIILERPRSGAAGHDGAGEALEKVRQVRGGNHGP